VQVGTAAGQDYEQLVLSIQERRTPRMRRTTGLVSKEHPIAIGRVPEETSSPS